MQIPPKVMDTDNFVLHEQAYTQKQSITLQVIISHVQIIILGKCIYCSYVLMVVGISDK